jgi:hypothetical protein
MLNHTHTLTTFWYPAVCTQVYRAAHLAPMRSVMQRGIGVLHAPYGHAAIAFMGGWGLALTWTHGWSDQSPVYPY